MRGSDHPKWARQLAAAVACAALVTGLAVVTGPAQAPTVDEHGPVGTGAVLSLSAFASRGPGVTASTGPGAAPPARIPWGRVGAGWSVAVEAPDAARYDRYVVYLVSPGGLRYRARTLALGGRGGLVRLADWSGDKRRALLELTGAGNTGDLTRVVDLDLATGSELGSFSVANLASAQFTRPAGADLLITTKSSVYRAYPDGALQARLPSQLVDHPVQTPLGEYPDPLYTPDGTRIVFQSSAGLEVATNAGMAVRSLRSPTGEACSPVRWWAPGTVLAWCGTGYYGGSQMGGQLWRVPVSGAAPSPVTPARHGAMAFIDEDAWVLPSGTYVQQVLMACAGWWLIGRLGPGGKVTRVRVPTSDGNVFVDGAYGARLQIRAALNCGQMGPGLPVVGDSLAWFDPVTKSLEVVLGPAPGNRATRRSSVVDALLYNPLPSSWQAGWL